MASLFRYLVFQSQVPLKLARFWGAALGDLPVDTGPSGCWVDLPQGNQPSRILFLHSDKTPGVGSRLHMHLNPGEVSLAREVARLIDLGATVISEHRRVDDIGWIVMADPDGNEFCVDSSDAEVEAFRTQHGISAE
ncbi:VOC family protein [Streptosporangium sp. NPDC006007]|uniref:VOC family protein n=1 Tax=Streptosporangium sp. NPDC006007 TaxID=3154575 RepID=UPI0033BBA860